MPNLTLEDVLQAKELRMARQEEMRRKHGLPIVSATVNMPGSIKDTRDSRDLLKYAVDCMSDKFKMAAVHIAYLLTGPEAILSVYGEGQEIKDYCITLEEQMPFGRLLDLDVFSCDGRLYSRAESGKLRQCFVCGQPAVVCMRERKHSQEDLITAVKALFQQFKAHMTHHVSPFAAKFGALATEAMLFEVTATPSPGLVDRVNNGAHKDMDFYTFMASSAALAHVMARCAQAGLNHEGDGPGLLNVIRYIGIEGEKAMFEATNGVNTHKGILFSLGIVAAAAGFVYKTDGAVTVARLFDCVEEMTKGIVNRELESARSKQRDRLTAGERLYIDYGVCGIRGEMERGLPAVRRGLYELDRAMTAGLPFNDSLLQTLLVLMTCVEDTTVMNRHNPDMMKVWVKEKIKEAIAQGGMYTEQGRNRVKELDDMFIDNNVSPGGAADMLAVTWFVYQVDKRL